MKHPLPLSSNSKFRLLTHFQGNQTCCLILKNLMASLAPFYVPLIKFHLSNTPNPHLFQFHVCIFTSLVQAFIGGQKLNFFVQQSFSFLQQSPKVTKTSNPMEENATRDIVKASIIFMVLKNRFGGERGREIIMFFLFFCLSVIK